MYAKANPRRDAFTFSLGGMAAINSYAMAPTIANDRINKALDERLSKPQVNQPETAREIEDFFARYFAPGRCGQAA